MGGEKLKKIKLKTKKKENPVKEFGLVDYTSNTEPLRELAPFEIERGILSRLNHIEKNFVRKVIYAHLDNGDKKEAIRVCKEHCSNGGSCSDGFWVTGKTKGVEIEVHFGRDSDRKGIIARGLVTYPQIVQYVIDNREKETKEWLEKSSPKKQKIKLKRKKK